MSNVPNFVMSGDSASQKLNSGNIFISKIKPDEALDFVCLTDVNVPEGQVVNGKNSLISFMEYTLWNKNLKDGEYSPSFPQLAPPYDFGEYFPDVKPKLKCMMLVMPSGTSEEKIFVFSASIYNQLISLEKSLKELTGKGVKGQLLSVRRTGTTQQNTKYTLSNIVSVTITGTGIPETNIFDHIYPKDEKQIIDLLTKKGYWPPASGDPFAPKNPVGVNKPTPTISAPEMVE